MGPADVSAKAIFGIVVGSWDLKTCNDHLVAFIDRARVLAEAYDFKGSLPSSLNERTSMMPPDASRLFSEEIARLKRVISMGRSKLNERRADRDRLMTDIKNFDSRIGGLEGKIGGLDGDYRNKIGHLDGELNGLKQKLRDLFAMFSAFAQSRYAEFHETSIYNYLLGFEEGRLSDNLHKVQWKATVHDSVVRTSHAAEVSIGGGSSSSFGHGYSVKSGSSGYKRESGYSSPANTPSSAHGGGMEVFDFPESVSYGEQSISKSSSRSSRHSSAGFGEHGMSTATTRSSHDNLFDSIKGDIL